MICDGVCSQVAVMLIVRAPSHTGSHVGKVMNYRGFQGITQMEGKSPSVYLFLIHSCLRREQPAERQHDLSCKCLFNANPQTS